MKKAVSIIPLLFFLYYNANGYAQDKIYWFTDSTKRSAQLTEDTSVSISVLADTTRLLMQSLPQYKFSSEFAQSPSITRLLKKLPNSCAPNRMKTPQRLENNIYSLPLNISLGLRLYFKQDTQSGVLSQNTFPSSLQIISLASLFTGKSSYVLGVDEGRSFGVFLDEQIAALEKHNLIVRRGGIATKSLVKMLLKNRVDYIIEYPVSINEALKSIPINIKLDSLRIANSPDYIVGYIACHKGSLGQKVIEDINRELQRLYRSYPFYQAHIQYFNKTDLINFNQAYQRIYNVAIPVKNSY
jgi:uncharacterized protein (TIGR02285 family)